MGLVARVDEVVTFTGTLVLMVTTTEVGAVLSPEV
jgi:hypothetical protein